MTESTALQSDVATDDPSPSPTEGYLAYLARGDLQEFAPEALPIFALQLRFGIEDPADLSEAITGGENDKKCDVFYIDDEYGVAIIVQSWESTKGYKQNPPLNKVSDLNTAASWLIAPTTHLGLRTSIVSAAEQLRAAIEDRQITAIELWYTHNCPDNDDVDAELAQAAQTAHALLLSTYGDDASQIECRGYQVGWDRLDDLYKRRSNQIIIDDLLGVPVDSWLSEETGNWRSVYTSVPGNWLSELYTTYGESRLFSGNVRDFLGAKKSKSDINRGIVTTAKDEPANFWAFNNGVTALVNEITEEGATLQVRGISIVNGAQTTGSLSQADASDDVRVLTRFVQCEDHELVTSLIRANNTQNEIRASDFRSNTVVQKALRAQFESIPDAHYTGARRSETGSKGASATDIHISADSAAQALAAFHGKPQHAYHGKSRIWEDDALYAEFFHEGTTARHLVYVASLIRSIQAIKKTLREMPERTTAEQDQFEFLSQRGAIFVLAEAIARCQETILRRALPDSFRLSFGSLVSPAVAEDIWRPLVNSLLTFHTRLGPAVVKGQIRIDEVRGPAIQEFSDVVLSIRDSLDETLFGPFRAHVIVD